MPAESQSVFCLYRFATRRSAPQIGRESRIVELRRLPILPLRYQLIERRCPSPTWLQQQNHVFHQKARIYQPCTYCMG